MFYQDEIDVTVSYAYNYLTKSHGPVKKTYILFTPFVGLANAFIYFIMGRSPALGLILVPVIRILLIFSIVAFPILFPVLFVRFDYSSVIRADRFAVRTTRNPSALISAIDRIYSLKGNPKFTVGLAYDLIRLNEKRHKQRIMRIERMQS
jgi:Zn-dependent protease with chaperone function